MEDVELYERLPGGGHPNLEATIALIRRFSIFGLGGSDGCECCHFHIHGFHVGVSCRKSEHTVRVYTHYLWFDPTDLQAIAVAVLSQLQNGNNRLDACKAGGVE